MFVNDSPTLLLPNVSGSKDSLIEVLSRLQCYAVAMSNSTNGRAPKLTIFLKHRNLLKIDGLGSNFPNLEIISLDKYANNIVGFSFVTIILLRRKQISPRILIAGDPWGGFIACFLVSIFSQKQKNIQYQVHGDPFTNKEDIFLRFLKKSIFYFSIKQANSIRVVSEHLQQFLKLNYATSLEKTFVSPIPVQLSKFENVEIPLNGLNIGFVGRLHPERGTDLFISILKSLQSHRIVFHMTVIGDGPDSRKIESAVKESDLANSVTLLGRVPNAKIAENYMAMNCLLVCAPEEGYGLSIREAVTQGVFVLALENRGTLSAQALFPESILLFQRIDQAIEILDSLRNMRLSGETISKNISKQEEIDYISISKLARSWMN